MTIFKDFATVECYSCGCKIAATAPLCPSCGRHRDKKEQDREFGISFLTGQNKVDQDDIVVFKVLFGGLLTIGGGLSLIFEPFSFITLFMLLIGIWMIKNILPN